MYNVILRAVMVCLKDTITTPLYRYAPLSSSLSMSAAIRGGQLSMPSVLQMRAEFPAL